MVFDLVVVVCVRVDAGKVLSPQILQYLLQKPVSKNARSKFGATLNEIFNAGPALEQRKVVDVNTDWAAEKFSQAKQEYFAFASAEVHTRSQLIHSHVHRSLIAGHFV